MFNDQELPMVPEQTSSQDGESFAVLARLLDEAERQEDKPETPRPVRQASLVPRPFAHD